MSAAQERTGHNLAYSAEKVTAREDEFYRDSLAFIVTAADAIGVDIRFVGGAISDLFSEETTMDVDPETKTIFLYDHKPLRLRRSDGSVKDIDMISLCPDKDKTESFYAVVKAQEALHTQEGWAVPAASLNPTYYENTPDTQNPWPKRKKLAQGVSSIDHDGNGYSLNFSSIHVPVSDRSLERWTMMLEDGTELPMFHPYIHVLRYYMRFAGGLKPKDREKVAHLFAVSTSVIEAYASHDDYKDIYAEDYQPWFRFIDEMCLNQSFDIAVKRGLSRLYWKTIGTDVAHGKGILGRFLVRFSDKGTG